MKKTGAQLKKQAVQWIQFICPQCGRDLAWTRPTAVVYCKKCDKWVGAADIVQMNPARMDPEDAQLTLF